MQFDGKVQSDKNCYVHNYFSVHKTEGVSCRKVDDMSNCGLTVCRFL